MKRKEPSKQQQHLGERKIGQKGRTKQVVVIKEANGDTQKR